MEVVCPHCKTVNRVQDERLSDAPVCGACKEPILLEHPIELTVENFDALIERSELPVVVDFWAPWCGPCRAMAPMIAEASKQLNGRAILAKIDTDTQSALAARFGIRSIPTVAIFKNRKELTRESGTRPAAEIVRWVERFL